MRTPSGGARRRSPSQVEFKTKPELGVELVERAAGWDVPSAPVLGDHAYGENTWLRDRLDEAGLRVRAVGRAQDEGVRAGHRVRGAIPRSPRAARAPARPRPDRTARADRRADRRSREQSAQTVTFRDGPDGEPVTSRFIFARVHAAHGWRERCRTAGVARGRRGSPARGMADRRMARRITSEPTDYWISNLPADTEPERLARLARMRWKMELDYKQLKGELGLDHYEGRSWLGLVSPHRAGDRRPRVPHPRAAEPFSPAAGLTLPKAVLLLQPLFKCWTGRCRTCHRPINVDRLPLTLDRHDE